jgi:hypothetical protein
MIKFVKFVDTTDSINACNHCHYGCNGTRDANNCSHWYECAGGYFVNKPPTQQRTRPRKSRDRRLLEALLKGCDVELQNLSEKALLHCGRRFYSITDKQEKQLISIKQAMEKKGGK